ncbi:hypothetical protein WJX72_002150 [[Myrmecia] bisecta]|uniref:DSBA-like thioredoxin domain-containing protein n=1 Tax=[Myrmecia] bisecta TaxID=41462 RepID=A0AAW1Q0E0_9CHLO
MAKKPVQVDVYSDYACPYCFLAEQPLQSAVQSLRDQKIGVDVNWKPFELRPRPNPTLKPEEDYLQGAWKNGVYPAAQRMGVPIKLPSVSPQPYTDLAFEGAQYAKEHGKADNYNHQVFVSFFQNDEDIGNLEVLTNIARRIGLDADDFAAALQSHKGASALGIHLVPTFLLRGSGQARQVSGVLPMQ